MSTNALRLKNILLFELHTLPAFNLLFLTQVPLKPVLNSSITNSSNDNSHLAT